MSKAQYLQGRKYQLCPTWRLHILVAAVGLAGAVSTQAVGVYFQDSYGLVSPSNDVTFSEFSPPPNTFITTQYQPYGVTFVPYVQYASIYDQTSGTPHIDPTACVANFQQYGPVVPTFSIVFSRPVSAAAFAVLSQPGTFQVTAFWAGTEVPGGPHTFTGGYGPDRTTNFVGFSDVVFDELRISNIATSDGALVVDNLQSTPAVVNSWTNLHSGRWDLSGNWSFGTLPASTQTVYIANDGYKAVNIDGATVANFPASLTVSNLLVAAPTNGLSTLLLNYAGLNTPLKVLNNCVIGINGTLANDYSSFEVDGNAGGQLLVNGGTFTQEGGQTVVNAPVLVRGNGSLNATNGNLTLGDVTLGGTNSPGSFNQDGGSIAAQSVTMEQGGGYTLASGILYAIGGTAIHTFGAFYQTGGTNYGDITASTASVGSGGYNISGGLAKGNLLTAHTDFFQSGGVVDMQTVDWTSHQGGLFAGTLRSKLINVHGSALLYMGQGSFDPGTVETESLSISNTAAVSVLTENLFVTNSLALRGDSSNVLARFLFQGGTEVGSTLTVGTITIGDNSIFNQEPSTITEISNGVDMQGGQFLLQGGLVESPYEGIGANATFTQRFQATNLVHGVLSISGKYIAAGTLVTDGIYLRGALVLDDPRSSSFMINFTNNGLMDLGGMLSTRGTDARPGQVRLSANATIGFIGTPAQLHFSPSSAIAWTPGALMVISNWNNSGNVHIFFGTSSAGLSASQLRQITFSNPGGFPAGNYPAQLLSTGELVPASRPTLQSARYGSGLVLSWPSGYQLLSSTNLNGPYAPVSGASSPWTNSFNKRQEFFRVQGM